MWIYYWLATNGINPLSTCKTIDGTSAADGREHARRQHGRLLRRRAVGQPRDLRQDRLHRGTTQDIWKDHPEKTLGTTAEFVQKYPTPRAR
jgi:nitrate/nitrite transport system substrate-binding protein